MSEKYENVVDYVNKATELSVCIERDITKGKKISSSTVLALSNFIVAQNKMQFLLDQISNRNAKLN